MLSWFSRTYTGGISVFEEVPSEVQRCNIIHSFSREKRERDNDKQGIK
jgi:hypothetical protein